MSLVKNLYTSDLRNLKRRYTTVRRQLETTIEVYSEMLHDQSPEADYFKNRVAEMKADAKALEIRFRNMGGDVSQLD